MYVLARTPAARASVARWKRSMVATHAVRVTVADPAAVEPLVLLLATFVARRMAEDASATAASTT
jgi:hypothetical protein